MPHYCSLFIIDLFLKCFSILVNYYFQVCFNLKVIMYIMAKITQNTLTRLRDQFDFVLRMRFLILNVHFISM